MTEICEKCGYSPEEENEIVKKLGLPLCKVCFQFAPDEPEKLDEYIEEKVSSDSLKSFRKYVNFASDKKISGMQKRASQGRIQSRAPFGYSWDKGNLVPSENYREVEEIFEEFMNSNLSLRQLSKKHSFSVNGLKKILTNFTYIGKVKFDGQIYSGNHKPIVSSTLFNHVQNKLEKLGIKV